MQLSGHVVQKQGQFKFSGFVSHVPVRHLLTSLAIFAPRDRSVAEGPFDWLVTLFDPVVIGPSNYFGVGFSTVSLKTSINCSCN